MSLTTQPTVLPSVNNTLSWHTLFEFRLRSETVTEAVYDLHNISTNTWHGVAGRHGIKVTFSTNTWSDDGTLDPLPPPVENGSLIEVSNSGGVVYQFTKPTSANASWISSGGGTGTEGFSYSGTLTVNGNDLEYDIPASSSSGSYYLLSGVNNTFSNELTITVGSNGASGSAPNFDQTKTWILRSPTEDELDRWSPPSTRKKVFCNFW